jgi:hypothetical protein
MVIALIIRKSSYILFLHLFIFKDYLNIFIIIWQLYGGRGFIVTFHMYIYFTPVWLISSFFFLLLLKMTSTIFNVPYDYMDINYQPYFPSLSSSLPSVFHCHSPLNMTYFTFLSFIIHMSVYCSVRFCLNILPVNIWYNNQSNTL